MNFDRNQHVLLHPLLRKWSRMELDAYFIRLDNVENDLECISKLKHMHSGKSIEL